MASHPGVVLPSEHWRTHLRRETDICATSNFSMLISFTEPAFFGLLHLRVFQSTQCVSVHPGTAELDSQFRCRNVCIARCRSCSSSVFCGMLVYHPHLTSIIVLKAVWAQACVLENKTPLSLSCIFGPSASTIVLCLRC